MLFKKTLEKKRKTKNVFDKYLDKYTRQPFNFIERVIFGEALSLENHQSSEMLKNSIASKKKLNITEGIQIIVKLISRNN